jgi:hypothetical protein
LQESSGAASVLAHARSDDGTKEVRQRISDAKDSGDKTTFSKWNS